MGWACEVAIDYDLFIPSHLPMTDGIMKSKPNKRKLASVLDTFNLGELATVEIRDNGVFCNDEAGVTIVLEAAQSGQNVIRMLSDGIDVFVQLVYLVNQTDILCKV